MSTTETILNIQYGLLCKRILGIHSAESIVFCCFLFLSCELKQNKFSVLPGKSRYDRTSKAEGEREEFTDLNRIMHQNPQKLGLDIIEIFVQI